MFFRINFSIGNLDEPLQLLHATQAIAASPDQNYRLCFAFHSRSCFFSVFTVWIVPVVRRTRNTLPQWLSDNIDVWFIGGLQRDKASRCDTALCHICFWCSSKVSMSHFSCESYRKMSLVSSSARAQCLRTMLLPYARDRNGLSSCRWLFSDASNHCTLFLICTCLARGADTTLLPKFICFHYCFLGARRPVLLHFSDHLPWHQS